MNLEEISFKVELDIPDFENLAYLDVKLLKTVHTHY